MLVRRFVCLVLFPLLTGLTIGEASGKPMPVDAEGFTVIFDGRSTDGWKMAGPGGFTLQEGMATPHGGMGLFYYAKKSFRNFILKVPFRQKSHEANSGVFVRFPDPQGDPWNPVKQGHEVQIYKNVVGNHNTGTLLDVNEPTHVPLKPAGEWNEYEITCIGPDYSIRLNGELINVASDRSREGLIGIQNHDNDGKGINIVDFRNIRVMELPDDASAYHVLFDGRGTDHWTMAGPGSFEFDKQAGTLQSRGGMGLFWHDQPFQNFVLMLDWKSSSEKDNSGVFVRFPDPKGDPWLAVKKGYEVQIANAEVSKHGTGSIYSFQSPKEVPAQPPGQWNHYRIEATNQHYTVYLNGTRINDFDGDRMLAGHIGLQNHDDNSLVTFRDVRVVALGPGVGSQAEGQN